MTRSFLALIIFFTLSININGQNLTVKYGPLLQERRTDAAMVKFRSNRFGQFIHWGLYAVPAGEWEGKIYPGAAEWLKSWAKIETASWDSLRFEFNPQKYDPKRWAKMASDLGVKYATITTKHHEGFCLWPSQYTDFDIESTPYKKDLLRPFVDAYTKAGIDVYFYYSILDWHHPDWRYDINTEADSIAFERYKNFTKNQLVELLELYPEVKGLWFDGTWDKSWKANGKFSYELEAHLKKLRPGLIVNSRMRADEYGSRHRDSNGNLMGDYESGYERRLPDPRDTMITKIDWESCMTIPENQWGYHKDWSISHVKSSFELIELLTHSVSQGGNFLLNFGPKADGTIRFEEIRLAREIGQWMKTNGEAIYNCSYAGLEKQDWGYFTKEQNGDKIYMVVFNVPLNNKLRIMLPKGIGVQKSYILNNNHQELKIEKFDKDESFIQLKNRKYIDPFVVVLETGPIK